MKPTRIKMSRHVQEERLDRLTYIAMEVGFGEVVLEQRYPDKRECVTDTGVILVKALNDEFLITAFVATIDKVSAIYLSNGYERIPTAIYNKIAKNTRHLKAQNEARY